MFWFGITDVLPVYGQVGKQRGVDIQATHYVQIGWWVEVGRYWKGFWPATLQVVA